MSITPTPSSLSLGNSLQSGRSSMPRFAYSSTTCDAVQLELEKLDDRLHPVSLGDLLPSRSSEEERRPSRARERLRPSGLPSAGLARIVPERPTCEAGGPVRTGQRGLGRERGPRDRRR